MSNNTGRAPDGKLNHALSRAHWLRPADVRQTFGISRSLLYVLIEQKKVKSRLLTVSGSGRASRCRVVSVDSLNEWIENQPSDQPMTAA